MGIPRVCFSPHTHTHQNHTGGRCRYIPHYKSHGIVQKPQYGSHPQLFMYYTTVNTYINSLNYIQKNKKKPNQATTADGRDLQGPYGNGRERGCSGRGPRRGDRAGEGECAKPSCWGLVLGWVRLGVMGGACGGPMGVGGSEVAAVGAHDAGIEREGRGRMKQFGTWPF